MGAVTYLGGWSPDDTALRARLAALARSAQTAGAEISAPARSGFLSRFEARAVELVEARLAKGERIADCPTEVQRVAATLLKAHMTELAHRPRTSRTARNKRTVKHERSLDGNQRSSLTTITPRSRRVSTESETAAGLPPNR